MGSVGHGGRPHCTRDHRDGGAVGRQRLSKMDMRVPWLWLRMQFFWLITMWAFAGVSWLLDGGGGMY